MCEWKGEEWGRSGEGMGSDSESILMVCFIKWHLDNGGGNGIMKWMHLNLPTFPVQLLI